MEQQQVEQEPVPMELNEEYGDFPVDPFDAPIPGQAMAADPEDKKPWDTPPEFTDINDALQEIFLNLTEGETYIDIMDGIRDGAYDIASLTQVVLFKGYTAGLWNTDLLVLLIEPTMYIIIALAEHNQIFDYKVYEEEEDELEDNEIVELLDDDINRMAPKRTKLNEAITKQPEDVLSDSLLAQVKQAPEAATLRDTVAGEE